MEALAEYDFEATDPAEMSFCRSDVVKILDMSDPYWFLAEMGGRSGYVPFNYVRLRLHRWYHANLSRQDAETVLQARTAEGTNFLVRTSESRPGDFSISVLYDTDKVRHLRVNRDVEFGMYYVWTKRFVSLNEMVEFYKTKSIFINETVFLQEAVRITHCVVRFDFASRRDDELALHRGDVITVLETGDDQWWEGEIEGRIGFFPANYTLPCSPPREEEEGEPHENAVHVTHCVARFDFEAKQDGELALKRGDVITVTEKSNEEWWRGKIGRLKGIFPSNHVVPCKPPRREEEEEEEEEFDEDAPLPFEIHCVARFDLDMERDDRLVLKRGDVITVTHMSSEDWWRGTIGDRTGAFPTNYVLPCSPGGTPGWPAGVKEALLAENSENLDPAEAQEPSGRPSATTAFPFPPL